jgi:hypothetical protein
VRRQPGLGHGVICLVPVVKQTLRDPSQEGPVGHQVLQIDRIEVHRAYTPAAGPALGDFTGVERDGRPAGELTGGSARVTL